MIAVLLTIVLVVGLIVASLLIGDKICDKYICYNEQFDFGYLLGATTASMILAIIVIVAQIA